MAEAGGNWSQLLKDAIQNNLALKKLSQEVKLINERLSEIEKELQLCLINCPKCNSLYHSIFEYCPKCLSKEE